MPSPESNNPLEEGTGFERQNPTTPEGDLKTEQADPHEAAHDQIISQKHAQLRDLMGDVDAAQADEQLKKLEEATGADVDEDGLIAGGKGATGGAKDELASMFGDIASIVKGMGKKKDKKDKKKGKEAASGDGDAEHPERERDASWPEPIDVKELEYKNSPISTKEGRRFWESRGFGKKVHPISGKVKQHDGLDLNVGKGAEDEHEPLYAGVDLEVVDISYESGGGNVMRVRDPENPSEVFVVRHLDEKPPFEEGEVLPAGTCFAKIGNTGTSTTGPHLHLEMEVNGAKVDPASKFGEALHLA